MKLKFYVHLFILFCSFLFVNLAIGQPLVNLALGKSSTVSSIEGDNPIFIPDSAFNGVGQDIADGTPNDGKARYGTPAVEYRRWSSERSDPQWIAVDLGARYEVREVKLYWEVASGRDYRIEVSDDGTTWTTASTVTGNPATTFYNDIVINPGVPARYVRMQGVTRNTTYGYSLYEFEVLGPNAILPIVLNDFSAVKKDNAVQLRWNASMDTESRFNIQRSANGADFTTIGKLYYPTGTNGISNSYSYLDGSPFAGVNYYRLEYTETGDATHYSKILSVRFAEERNFIISPNPVTGNVIRVELDIFRQQKISMRLLTASGNVVNQQEFNSDSKVYYMKLNRFVAPGNYILQVIEGQTIRSRQVIFK